LVLRDCDAVCHAGLCGDRWFEMAVVIIAFFSSSARRLAFKQMNK
jgi:hypothetical protein